MEAFHTLFDGLETALKQAEDLYFHTYSFRSPEQMGGQEKWKLVDAVLGKKEVTSSRTLRGLSEWYRPKVRELLCDNAWEFDAKRKAEMLKRQRMILADCLSSARAIRAALANASRRNDSAYQDFDPVEIVEFSHTHIPFVRGMEQENEAYPMDGQRLENVYRQMKDEQKLEEKFGMRPELHARVAAHPVLRDKVYGYAFTKTLSHPQRIKECRYPVDRDPFSEKRVVTEIMAFQIRPELIHMAFPALADDMLSHAKETGSDRLECQIDAYHPRY